MLWIRIRKDPHHFGNLDPEPDQFADVKPKCMEYEPILAFFQGFELFFKARIWIRIRICIWVRSPHQIKNQNPHPDPHQGDKSRIRIRIRIRIKVMGIHNAGLLGILRYNSIRQLDFSTTPFITKSVKNKHTANYCRSQLDSTTTLSVTKNINNSTPHSVLVNTD